MNEGSSSSWKKEERLQSLGRGKGMRKMALVVYIALQASKD